MLIKDSDYYYCVVCGNEQGFPVSPEHEPEAYTCENCKTVKKEYSHGEGCPCVECEHIYIHNESLQPCKNSQCDELTDNQGNFGYCKTCTKRALDNAFKTLQVSLSIDPETGKSTDKFTQDEINQARKKLSV